MRFKRAITAALGLAAALSVAVVTPSSAAGDSYQITGSVERPQGPRTNTTDGNSFLEINGSGQLVLWRRTGSTFYGEVRGTDWQNTRIISTLSADAFVEVKGDGRLAKWTWNGWTYVQQIVGSGWDNARLLTGLSYNRFLEINRQGNLVVWTFDNFNNLSAVQKGTGWENTKSITGLDYIDFLEVKGDNRLSEWIDYNGFNEYPLANDFSGARLLAGTDVNHFVLIDANDGSLWELSYSEGPGWTAAQRGAGWGATRLIG